MATTTSSPTAPSRSYRFGLNLFGIGEAAAFRAKCQQAERLGFDVLNVGDHLHAPAPFQHAVAAAEATQRVRVGTGVLNIGFWNPALLAREVATVDQLTSGRFELGLGGGTVRAEFDEAGIAWEPIGARLDRLERAIEHLERTFTEANGSAHEPTLVQRPRPPLLVGGSGERALRVAARHADILGFGAVQQVPGAPAGALDLMPAATVDERMAYFRACAGDKAADKEVSVLLQRVTITDDRRAAAEALRQEGIALSVEAILEAPGVLFGTVAEIADQIHERAARYGFTYLTMHEPSMAAMAEVIAALATRGPPL